MKVVKTALPGVLIFEPDVYEDARGCFFESFNEKQFEEATGRQLRFVQDNQSHSVKGVLRGLHYQIKQPQGKLIRTIQGEIYDVAVDLHRGSPTFGKWLGVTLSAENRKQLWIPEGFAHGFLTLSETADLLYKVTDYYAPQHECSLIWNDPALAISWPIDGTPILSDRDRQAPPLDKAEVFA
jgi:dTDP-4-dehydrorhamnose 3,5-epimerase